MKKREKKKTLYWNKTDLCLILYGARGEKCWMEKCNDAQGNDNVPGTFVYVLLYRSLYGYLVY